MKNDSSECESGGVTVLYLEHELTVVPPHKDHFPGETVTRPPAAHQEPGSQTHLCLTSSPLTLKTVRVRLHLSIYLSIYESYLDQ